MKTDDTDKQKQNRDRLYAVASALAKLLVLRKTEDGYVLEWRCDEDDYDFCDWEDMN